MSFVAAFVLVAVCSFGIRWPIDFKDDLYGTQPTLSYSFYLACACTTLATGVFITVDICITQREVQQSVRYHDRVIDNDMLDDAFDEVDGCSDTIDPFLS